MRTNGLVFLMITLALGVVVYGLALKWSTVTGGQSGLTGIRRPEALRDAWVYYYFSFWVLVAVLVVLAVVSRSPLGLTFRGVRDSESRMASLGYRTPAAKFVAIMLSGLVAGIAGVLTVWNSQFISPSVAAFHVSAMAVIIIIIGGVGAPLGPLVGAALVVAIQHWLSSYVERWPTLLGLLFIAVVILLPRGVVGVISRPGGGPPRTLADLFRRPAPAEPSDLSSADLVDARGRSQEG
jgi:branched-chain amino acid transport system permease protein